MKKKFEIKVIAEVAIFAAIAFVLDYIQGIYSKSMFPNGGSIGIAMVPIFMISYRRGLIAGLLCALVLSLIQMLGGIYIINTGEIKSALETIGITNSGVIGFFEITGPFIQVMLDYVLAYTLVGFAGVFSKKYQQSNETKKNILFVSLGVILGGMLKYISHSLSGLFFWPGEIFGISGIMYSFIYNGLYCIPNIILSLVIMIILAKYYPIIMKKDDKD